ncbi:hatching enzyme 1.2-like [Clytia hemisphaerica]|uniref:Metalloendopeptidase n=1 Tax=Clytia hemisphaerica TaxID=252671 RepID=A0A7M6DNK5_9CNID
MKMHAKMLIWILPLLGIMISAESFEERGIVKRKQEKNGGKNPRIGHKGTSEINTNRKYGLITDEKYPPQMIKEMKRKNNKRVFQNVDRYYWKPNRNGVLEIPYKFNKDFTIAEQQQIKNVIKKVNGYLSGCHNNAWVPAAARHYGKTVLEFGKRVGCWSYVGKVGEHYLESFPNAIQPLSIDDGCFLEGIIAHEMMHAMGFHHEHSRPDRDQFVQIRRENILGGCENNFDIATNTVPDYAISPYDYGSVMHYGLFDFTSNGKQVIIPKKTIPPGVQVGQRNGLSNGDIAELRRLFKC